MTERSGLGASLGVGEESTWGVPVTPTVWYPFLEESIEHNIERSESEAIIAGARVLRSGQRRPTTYGVSGDVGLEVPMVDMGILLKHMMGGSSTTGPFTPADLPVGLTVQIGKPDSTDGTVHPYTYSGCKVGEWEIAFDEGEHVTLGLTLLGKQEILYRTVTDGATTNTSTAITSATAVFDESDIGKPISGTGIPSATTIAAVTSATAATLSAAATATASGVTFTIGIALTTPSYTSGVADGYDYYDASVTIGGSSFKVKSGTLTGNNNLADDRAFAGQRYMDEPIAAGIRSYGGTLDTEFFSETAYRRFVRGDEAALVVTFARGTKSITVTENVMFDGATPNVGDRGIIGQSLPFTAVGTTTDASAISIALDET